MLVLAVRRALHGPKIGANRHEKRQWRYATAFAKRTLLILLVLEIIRVDFDIVVPLLG